MVGIARAPIDRIMDTTELRDRVEARKSELLAKYKELKSDSQKEAIETRTKIKGKLSKLDAYLKNGWDNVNEAVRAKLDKWLEHD